VLLEQLQSECLIALSQRAVVHHVREHYRGELAEFGRRVWHGTG
jgi:hypothetical protein